MFSFIASSITPTDIRVYVEDNIPYLDYVGKCSMSDGSICKIHFPKVKLDFTEVERIEEDFYACYNATKHKFYSRFNVYAKNDQLFELEILERDVTKKQLEKELGYKLNIKEN